LVDSRATTIKLFSKISDSEVLQMTSDAYFQSRGLRAPAYVLESELRFHRTIASEPITEGAILPDPDYPQLYRLRLPDGSLSDLVNLTRAKDAARSYGMIELPKASRAAAEKAYRTIQCAQCGATIERARRLQKFCNDDCKFEYRNKAA
jgi:hypothetical protein